MAQFGERRKPEPTVDLVITSAVRDSRGLVTIGLDAAPGEEDKTAGGSLIVINAPPAFEDAVIGSTVSVSKSRVLMLGLKWGERIGADRMKLVTRRKLQVEEV
jgi:hypothetical protein